jgi:hypothetical protein
MNISIFALGVLGKGLVEFFSLFSDIKIVSIIDDNQKGKYKGIDIINSNSIDTSSDDYIIIALENIETSKKIRSKLVNLGYQEDKILIETLNYQLLKDMIHIFDTNHIDMAIQQMLTKDSSLDYFFSNLYLEKLKIDSSKRYISIAIDHCKYNRGHLDFVNKISQIEQKDIINVSLDTYCDEAIFLFSRYIFKFIDTISESIFTTHMINYRFKNIKVIFLVHSLHQARLLMTPSNSFKNSLSRLSNIDYFLSPSKFYINDYKRFYKNGWLDYLPKTHLIDYPKIKKQIKEFKSLNIINKKNIVYAPTTNGLTNDYRLKNDDVAIQIGYDIIDFLINNFKEYNIIFRPHPTDRDHPYVKRILRKFGKLSRFEYDVSNNYVKTYAKSEILITDFSDTAFSYSYITERNSIFFKPIKYSYTSKFIKDVYSIGKVVKTFEELKYLIINSSKELPSKNRVKLNKVNTIQLDKVDIYLLYKDIIDI